MVQGGTIRLNVVSYLSGSAAAICLFLEIPKQVYRCIIVLLGELIEHKPQVDDGPSTFRTSIMLKDA